MSLREAAEKALEALEITTAFVDGCPIDWGRGYVPEADEAINALRAALAEAEEPVAWYSPSGEGYDSSFRDHSTVVACDGGDWSEWIPLYTHPPRREPLVRYGCPVCGIGAKGEVMGYVCTREDCPTRITC